VKKLLGDDLVGRFSYVSLIKLGNVEAFKQALLGMWTSSRTAPYRYCVGSYSFHPALSWFLSLHNMHCQLPSSAPYLRCRLLTTASANTYYPSCTSLQSIEVCALLPTCQEEKINCSYHITDSTCRPKATGLLPLLSPSSWNSLPDPVRSPNSTKAASISVRTVYTSTPTALGGFRRCASLYKSIHIDTDVDIDGGSQFD